MSGLQLAFEIDSILEMGLLNGYAGLLNLVEAFRQAGTAVVIDRKVVIAIRNPY